VRMSTASYIRAADIIKLETFAHCTPLHQSGSQFVE
jgi:hypothetical protein